MSPDRRSTARVVVAVGLLLAAWCTVALATPGAARAQPLDWDAVAQCESGGDWSAETGNGFSGGLQFTQATWTAHGGRGVPSGASRAEQIRVAERVARTQGLRAWPTCGSAAWGRSPGVPGAVGVPAARPGGAVGYVRATLDEIAGLLAGFAG